MNSFGQNVRVALRNSGMLRRLLKHGRLWATVVIPRMFLNIWRWIWPPSLPGSLPGGTFSLLDSALTQAGSSEGRLVLHNQGAPVVASDSLTLVCGLNQHREQPWPIFWKRVRNARLTGLSLALRAPNGRLCAESVYGAARVKTDKSYYSTLSASPVRLNGPWTSIVSRWMRTERHTGVYAHWLFDALPRLAVLPELPSETRVVVPPNYFPFQAESLRLLGLEQRVRPTHERDLLVEDYYFSSPTSMVVCWNPYGVRFVRDRLVPHGKAPPQSPERIFVTRPGFLRTASNLPEVEEFFRARGFTVMDLTGLSFAEQIGLFQRAKIVSGIHGAGFSNCLWCQPGALLFEIVADCHMNGCFEWLMQAVGGRHGYIVFPSDANHSAIVDLQALERKWRELGL